MNLRTLFCLGTGAAVLVLFGVWEWISLEHASKFLLSHEIVLRDSDSAAAIASFSVGREQLLSELRWMRWGYALGVVPLLMTLLYFSWHSLIVERLRKLLTHINAMKRGSWTDPMPVQRQDEIGEITSAFNELGVELSMAVYQHSATSKLAALALVGQRLVRKVKISADRIDSVKTLLGAARQRDEKIPEVALKNLALVARDLNQLETDFNLQFTAEFRRCSFPGMPVNSTTAKALKTVSQETEAQKQNSVHPSPTSANRRLAAIHSKAI